MIKSCSGTFSPIVDHLVLQ